MTDCHYSPGGSDETLCGEPAYRARTVSAVGFFLAKAGKAEDDPCPECSEVADGLYEELPE